MRVAQQGCWIPHLRRRQRNCLSARKLRARKSSRLPQHWRIACHSWASSTSFKVSRGFSHDQSAKQPSWVYLALTDIFAGDTQLYFPLQGYSKLLDLDMMLIAPFSGLTKMAVHLLNPQDGAQEVLLHSCASMSMKHSPFCSGT